MAIPTFVAAGTFAHASNVSPLTVNFPASLSNDDILLLFVENDQANAAPTCSTFTLVSANATTGGGTTTNTRLTTFWLRYAGVGTSASVVVGSTDHTMARIYAFRGCATSGNPWSITSNGVQSTATTAFSATGTSTSHDDCLVVVAGSSPADTATSQFASWANASLANVAEIGDDFQTDGDGGGIGVATGDKALLGAYSATTATLLTSNKFAFQTIALKPPGAAVGQIDFLGDMPL